MYFTNKLFMIRHQQPLHGLCIPHPPSEPALVRHKKPELVPELSVHATQGANRLGLWKFLGGGQAAGLLTFKLEMSFLYESSSHFNAIVFSTRLA